MLNTIIIVIVVLLAGVLGYAATRPDSFSIQRSITIKAPPEKIYPLISDVHQWGEWSPWEKLDPGMQRSFIGAASGQGAVYAWDGQGKVGAGRMEILQAAAPSSIVIQLDFLRPFKNRTTATFTLQSQGDGTTVSWVMAGPSPYISKLMGLFFNMDKLIGADFETGLANLKRLGEQ